MTYPDFHLYEMLDQHLIFQPDILDHCPHLQRYHKDFRVRMVFDFLVVVIFFIHSFLVSYHILSVCLINLSIQIKEKYSKVFLTAGYGGTIKLKWNE